MMLLFILCAVVGALRDVTGAPLARKMVDMSYRFDDTTLHFPGTKEFEIIVVRNGTMEENGIWVQSEEYSSSTHVGTHMDAPAHFTKGGLTIDQIPVHRFIAPAAVIDITAKAQLDRDAEATVEDLLHWESITGQTLNETIVLLKTGWGKKWNNRTDFFGTPENDATKLHFPGLAPDAATWLVENRNIYGIGTETLSFEKGATRTYPVHQTLLGHGIYGLENVANVDKIPIYGAKLYVLPMKVGRASGAPTRIIATYPIILDPPSSSN
ncbi:isatin hydrolase-like [Argiope bruennichi]|uniref:Isatin hydrolase like protein n=1 Tax=Argiope bruennichi TaxID=94029 RepID=A0A8T0EPY7_ARGBR|nr:isatin hydrolase-like [Argiope bruennichi]KAF8777850.1 Isatin hydrolase like protein [Argiope bruennichi]